MPFTLGLWCLSLIGCKEPRATPPSEVTLAPLDTLLSTESAILAKPSEVHVAEDGRIFIADVGASAVVVVGSDGERLGQVGRQGAGPGEFERPRSLVLFRDTLMLIDGAHGRLNVYSTGGDFISSTLLPAEGVSFAVSLLPSREMLIALQGNDSALARRYLPGWTPGSLLGTPLATAPDVWNFPAIKQDIAEGRVPDFLRNLVLPVLGPDRSATLVMMTERQVLRYNHMDSLEWIFPLAAPELDAILQRFFAQNQADSNQSQFHMLSYVTAAKYVGADLWLQLRTPPEIPNVILVVDPNGKLKRRMVIPGAPGNGSFAVDTARRLLYIVGLDDAILLRARLP